MKHSVRMAIAGIGLGLCAGALPAAAAAPVITWCDDDEPAGTPEPGAAEVAAHRKFTPQVLHYKGRIELAPGVAVTVAVNPAGKVVCLYKFQGEDGNSVLTTERVALMTAAMRWRYTPFLSKGKPATVLITEHITEDLDVTSTPMPQGRLFATTITLERGACFGTCPSYGVRVKGNGDVTYDGDGFADLQGRLRYHISPGEVAGLIERMRSRDLWSMQPSYHAAITDNPTYVIGMTIAGQSKTVVDYVGRSAGMPEAVTLMEDDIDATSGAADLVNLTARGLNILRSANFDFTSRRSADLLMQAIRNDAVSDDTLLELIELGAPGTGGKASMEGIVRIRVSGDDPTALDEALAFSRQALVAKLIDKGGLKKAGKIDQGRVDAAFRNAIIGGRLAPVQMLAAYHPALTFDGLAEGEVRADGGPSPVVAPVTLLLSRIRYNDEPGDREAFAIARYLIELGCDINGKDSAGATLLMIAANDGDAAFVRWLLERGADARAVNAEGETALTKTSDEDVALMLLEAGADPTAAPETGRNVFRYAQEDKWTRVIAWLEAHGYGAQLKANAPAAS